MSAPRPCLTCGTLTTYGSRCEEHTRQEQNRQKRRRRAPEYDDRAWRALSAEILREHRREQGDICPGVDGEHLPHLTRDLTVDHVVPFRDGGALLDRANTRVLCRSYNGTLANRHEERP
jgi:5-methylcytosine-specific restriction protein A